MRKLKNENKETYRKIIVNKRDEQKFREILAQVYLKSSQRKYTFTESIEILRYFGILDKKYSKKEVEEIIFDDVSGSYVIEDAKKKILEREIDTYIN